MKNTRPIEKMEWLVKIGALSIVILLTTLFILNHFNHSLEAEEEVIAWCATESPDYALTAEDREVVENGKNLFKNYCAACHHKNMRDDLTGPALGDVEFRWSEYPRADLYSWIRNSQFMIESGHPMAVALWEEWGPTVMTSFPEFSDEDIEAVLAYIDL